MFGQLGDIVFEMLKEPVSMNIDKKYTYAEHQVIRGKTKLQFTGHEPYDLSIKVRFHASFCEVEEESKRLAQMAFKRDSDGYLAPLPFMVGEDIIGEFVITDINREYVKTFPDGRLIELVCDIKLKEFV